ncbi:MAG TPA: hypothetical protein PKH77_18655 [Anaerolineae bacterium]|nr:hypothetical protein [Anaerolineae bacterium]
MRTVSSAQPARLEEIFTLLIGLLTLGAAGAGVFIPGFYDGIVDPRYATGTITADVVSLISVPLLGLCVWLARRGSLVARMAWIALVVYLGYAYATYAFDRLYTVFFLAYVAIFSLSCIVGVSLLARLDVAQLAEATREMPLRRVTAGFLVFTGLVLYAIELPILLARIPGEIQSGGTPFMVLDMALVAPLSILTGIWLWQRQPWGAALTGIFLIKAITLMSGFLAADYIDWFAGRPMEPPATIAFTVIYLLVYGFTWNYFAAFAKPNGKAEALK